MGTFIVGSHVDGQHHFNCWATKYIGCIGKKTKPKMKKIIHIGHRESWLLMYRVVRLFVGLRRSKWPSVLLDFNLKGKTTSVQYHTKKAENAYIAKLRMFKKNIQDMWACLLVFLQSSLGFSAVVQL